MVSISCWVTLFALSSNIRSLSYQARTRAGIKSGVISTTTRRSYLAGTHRVTFHLQDHISLLLHSVSLPVRMSPSCPELSCSVCVRV